MPSWFALPAEIRNNVYEVVYSGLCLKPVQRTSGQQHDTPRFSSLTVAPLCVSKQWFEEASPYLYQSARFNFTAHPGDPPYLVHASAYAKLRHVVILETHCFSLAWQTQVFDRMLDVETMTIRKMRKLGCIDNSIYHGPGLTDELKVKVRHDPISTLLCGYHFDHVYIKQMLKSNFPARKILLDGTLWLSDQAGAIHSNYHINLETWKVQIWNSRTASTRCTIQAIEPAVVRLLPQDDEEGMFEYRVWQQLLS